MTRSRFPALSLAASAAMTLCLPLPASAVEPAALLALSSKSPALRLAPVAAGRAHL